MLKSLQNSPLQRESGDGLQNVYLAHVPGPMARFLLNQTRVRASSEIVLKSNGQPQRLY